MIILCIVFACGFFIPKFISIETLLPAAQAASTEDYYKCPTPEDGEWNFGRAPKVCPANAFGEDRVVVDNFSRLIFLDNNPRTSERERYVDDLHAVVRDAARIYFSKRKPDAPAAELDWWTRGILATASHESYMSHYRYLTTGQLYMMRGDFGHGHGMMQIDDRAHFPVIDNGIAWNLITNLTYAMDLYFREWESAPQQPCVSSPTNYETRARSAWSAYNGGSINICRWTDPNSKWARNDIAYYNSLKNRPWVQWIINENKLAPIDVACYMEQKENCPAIEDTTPSEEAEPGHLYKISETAYCVYDGQQFQCLRQFRDTICLNKVMELVHSEPEHLTAQALAGIPQQNLDRHLLCQQYEPSLFAVGRLIQLLKTIHIRATPGGGSLAFAAENSIVQILGFELRHHDRYYQIRQGKTTGWIYAGNETDFSEWAMLKAAPSQPSSPAQRGETITIVKKGGINLRVSPGGSWLATIPGDTRLSVQKPVIFGETNSVYYKVSYLGRTGYIYSGQLLPTSSVSLWTHVVE